MKAETKTCKPLRVIAKLTASSLLALGLLAPAAQAAMYRWVDARGQVHYGDTLPDTYQKSGAAELGKQGQVVKRTLSEDERRATAAREAEELGKRRAATDQARQDRALLSSFSSVEEIDLAEERALDARASVGRPGGEIGHVAHPRGPLLGQHPVIRRRPRA